MVFFLAKIRHKPDETLFIILFLAQQQKQSGLMSSVFALFYFSASLLQLRVKAEATAPIKKARDKIFYLISFYFIFVDFPIQLDCERKTPNDFPLAVCLSHWKTKIKKRKQVFSLNFP